MCGITLFISKNTKHNAIEEVLNSLKNLQNRGYDSFGISFYNPVNSLFSIEKISKQSHGLNPDKRTQLLDYFTTEIIKKYKDQLKDATNVNVCMGHSRWATHGRVNDINAHPHISQTNKFIIVHNGIIENYSELKDQLSKSGYVFHSETDTEVIVNLIDFCYHTIVSKETTWSNTEVIGQAINETIKKLRGTYGLVILNNITSEDVFIVRNGSPLVLSESDDFIIASSELCGLHEDCSSFIELNQNEVFHIKMEQNIEKSKSLCKYFGKQIQIDQSLFSVLHESNLGLFEYYTQKEIWEQSKTLQLTLNNGGRIQNNRVKLGGVSFLKPHLQNIKRIYLLGCGSSYYACCIGERMIRECINENIRSDTDYDIDIKAIDAGEFDEMMISKSHTTLFIFISQSGETMDILKHLPKIKSNVHFTMAITNVVGSSLAKEVDGGIYMNVGREVAVASTKSFTSSILCLKLFSLWITQHLQKSETELSQHLTRYYENQISQIRIIPHNVQQINDNINATLDENYNINYLNSDNIFILGKGNLEFIAKEFALKLKEICYIHAEGMSASSMKHGPLALIQNGYPVILLVSLSNYEKMMNIYQELKCRGAYVLIICTQNCSDNIKKTIISMEPQVLNENELNNQYICIPDNGVLDEINFSVLLQHICFKLSILREINPDQPRNLAKVVTVE